MAALKKKKQAGKLRPIISEVYPWQQDKGGESPRRPLISAQSPSAESAR